jgi:hypothetical protein
MEEAKKGLIKADKSKNALCSCVPKWPKIEEHVKKWKLDRRKNGIAISTKIILIETRRLAIELPINDFAGTTPWCKKIMRNNGLCMRTKTTIAQQLSRENERKFIEFTLYVKNMRKKLCIKIGKLGNLGEIHFTFDVPSNKTVNVKVLRQL